MFGNGKTAIKVSLNRYLQNEAAGSPLAVEPSPLNTLVTTTTRSWNDANRNFAADCNLLSPVANGECGAMANAAFGTLRPGSTYDPDLLRGWGKRMANWEFSAGVQHELMPRTSLDVAYFRRSYQNFVVTDNRAVSAADYDRFSITAPIDPRLPGGGGYVVVGPLRPQADQLRSRRRQLRDALEQLRRSDRTLAGCGRGHQHRGRPSACSCRAASAPGS